MGLALSLQRQLRHAPLDSRQTLQIALSASAPFLLRFLYSRVVRTFCKPCRAAANPFWVGGGTTVGSFRLKKEVHRQALQQALSPEGILSADVTLDRHCSLLSCCCPCNIELPTGTALFWVQGQEPPPPPHLPPQIILSGTSKPIAAGLTPSTLAELDMQKNYEIIHHSCVDTRYLDLMPFPQALATMKSRRYLVVLSCLSRLVLWHLFQPAMYLWIFHVYYNILDQLQQVLGWIVAGRELVYIFLCVVGIIRWPSFLLFDPWRNTKVRPLLALMFVLSPEKFVIRFALRGFLRRLWLANGIATLILLADMSAIVALILAIIVGPFCPPLAVGYIITSLGGICALMIWCCPPIRRALPPAISLDASRVPIIFLGLDLSALGPTMSLEDQDSYGRS